jgi:microcystin-dependent protein
MSSTFPPDQPGLPPPPPTTRTLANVLREALEKGDPVRLIIAKALPDAGGLNTAAYMTVDIEGTSFNVPKVNGAGLGGATGGYPVYVLATSDFMLAVGTVTPTASAGGAGLMPVGGIIQWPTATAPTGFLACDGSGFSSATYPLLAAVLGGTTLPDLRRRVPVGRGTGPFSIGATEGLGEGSRAGVAHHHRLSAGVSVAGVGDHQHPGVGDHSHGPASPGTAAFFAMSINNVAALGSGGANRNLVSEVQGSTAGAGGHQHGAAGGHSHSASVDADTSGGGPQDAVAFIVLNFIIRAA